MPYYSKGRMAKLYPNGGYIVIGAVGKGLKTPAGTAELEGGVLPYFTNQYPKATHKVVGYMACGGDNYLAVVKRAWLRWLILGLLLLLALEAGVLWNQYQAQEAEAVAEVEAANALIDENATNYDTAIYLEQVTDPYHIALPGYSEIPMYADSDYMQIALWNPTGNPCFFQFSIVMGDEVLYESKLVPPGLAVQEQTLSRTIPEGTYDATIKIRCYDLEDTEEEMNGGAINVTIKALAR